MFSQISDPSFCNTILMVCANSTECDGLSCLLDCFHECRLSKPAIVSMIVLNGDIQVGCKRLKCILGFNGFLSSCALGDMDIAEARVVVCKDSGDMVP